MKRNNLPTYWLSLVLLCMASLLSSCSKKDADPTPSPVAAAKKTDVATYIFTYSSYPAYTGDLLTVDWRLPKGGSLLYPLPPGLAKSVTLEFKIGANTVLVAPHVPVTFTEDVERMSLQYALPTFLASATYELVITGENGGIGVGYWTPRNGNGFNLYLSDDVEIVRKPNTTDYPSGVGSFQSVGAAYTTTLPTLYWSTSLFGSNDALRVYLTQAESRTSVTYDVGLYTQPGPDGRGVLTNSGSVTAQQISAIPPGLYEVVVGNTNTATTPSLSSCSYARGVYITLQ